MSNPHEWHIASDRDGFFIEDEFGEEVNPKWMPYPDAGFRSRSYEVALSVLAETVRHELDNYEPTDAELIGDAWSGGFADNH